MTAGHFHILLTVSLVPFVALKLGSSGWRMIRYFTSDPAYRREGPPRPFLCGIAPLRGRAFAVVSGGAVAVAALETLGPWATVMHRHIGG